MTAFMQPHSLTSGESCLKRDMISWMVLSSAAVSSSCGSRSRAWGDSSSADRSQGMDHCARCSRNSSFQDSWSSSSCGHSALSFYKGLGEGADHERDKRKRSRGV